MVTHVQHNCWSRMDGRFSIRRLVVVWCVRVSEREREREKEKEREGERE